MILGILGHDFAYEMECVVRLFFPGNKILIVKENNITEENVIITRIDSTAPDKLILTASIRLDGFEKSAEATIKAKIPKDNGLLERKLAAMLFELLAEQTGKRLAWGILTGIRPVRLCEKWAEEGLDDARILVRLTDDYLVSPGKAELCIRTGKAQEHILARNAPDCFSLYISIPFCPTRCLYCSFVSQSTQKDTRLVPEYVRLLREEIAYTGRIAKDMGLKLHTVYMGGGTPTTLSAGQLNDILESVESAFDLSGLLEYTVEAGRPDTISREKLDVMRGFGVDRISINPQSMNDNVLKAIGRPHDSIKVEESLALARQAGFKSVNMDLIAGLPSETMQSFMESVQKVIALEPENITVHTLTVKRSSNLRDAADAFADVNPQTGEMLEYAENRLVTGKYFPYYLYKQKAAVDNLENAGFSKRGCEGVYNIYSMQDTHTIFAVGAGAVSKLCFNTENLSRIFNYKYPYEYINRFEDVLKRKGAIYATNY